MGSLAGKTALVTGGSRGIGLSIAETFAERGATVVACGRGERPAGLRESVAWRKCDVSSTTSVDELKDFASSSLGTLDAIVNNAGIQVEKTVADSTDADWDAVMGTNAKGVFNVCRAFLPMMSEKGSIVNIGSVSGNASDHGMALYNGSKAFVHGLTRSIAVDHGPRVRCNAICPGWIMTGMADAAFALAQDAEAARQDALARHPAGRFGKPQDVANLAAWLAGDDSEFVTGQCFVVDGGLTSGSPINPALL